MQIIKDSIVSITYQLANSACKVLEQTDEPISYLHGGYDNIFPTVEAELQGKNVGGSLTITLQPEYAFGESDDGQDMLLYTVTEITDDTIVVDGNHSLAGQTLKFTCTSPMCVLLQRKKLNMGTRMEWTPPLSSSIRISSLPERAGRF